MASSTSSGNVERQDGGALKIPTAPGPHPRRISLAEWHSHLPAFLQMGTIVTPLCAVGTTAWTALALSNQPFRLFLFSIGALALAIGWALIYRWRFVRYPAVRAVITSLSPSGVGGVSATEVNYSYEFAGRSYRGSHQMFDAKLLAPGASIWILVNPSRPERSVAWL
jgi:hypothetical protein